MTEAIDFRPTWAEMGLDLEEYNALLGVLGQVYSDIYLAQNNRPDGMYTTIETLRLRKGSFGYEH